MRDRDRSPQAVARAWYDQHAGRTLEVAHVAALIRAIRRECARVARANRVNHNTMDGAAFNAGLGVAARQILALNRAPKKEARRG